MLIALVPAGPPTPTDPTALHGQAILGIAKERKFEEPLPNMSKMDWQQINNFTWELTAVKTTLDYEVAIFWTNLFDL